MTRTRATLSLGATAAVLLVAVAYLGFGVLRIDPFREYTAVRLLTENSGGIVRDSPVLLTGVRIGEVVDVRRTGGEVEIAFRFEDRYRVPAASAVRIEQLSALGEPYLAFDPPGPDGPYLTDGQVVTAAVTPRLSSISQLSTRVVELLGQFDPTAIDSLVRTLATGLSGTETVTPQLERATRLLAATLLSRTTTIQALLTDLQTIGGDLAWAGPALAESGPHWGQFGDVINRVIDDVSPFIDHGDTPTMYTTGDGLLPFVDLLTDVVHEIGPGIGELTPVLAPMLASTTTGLRHLDISALLTQALSAVGDDGTLRLRLDVN